MEAEQRGMELGIERGRMSMLCDLVRLGWLTVEDAAQMMGLSPRSFELEMNAYDEAGSSAMNVS